MVFEKLEFVFLGSLIDDFVACLSEEVIFFFDLVVLLDATVELFVELTVEVNIRFTDYVSSI